MDAFRSELRGEVLVLTLDVPGESVNTLSPPLIAAFEEQLQRVEQDDAVKAVVFTSGKPDFLVGADVKWLDTLRTAEEGEKASRAGHEGSTGWPCPGSRSSPPSTAPASAAAWRWALACQGRVASDYRRTQLGLPEVQLGLIPGAGGTQRLPRLIGVQAALDIILTGKSVRAAKARKLGLVDEVVPVSHADRRRAVEHAQALAAGASTWSCSCGALGREKAVTHAALESNPLGRQAPLRRGRRSSCCARPAALPGARARAGRGP